MKKENWAMKEMERVEGCVDLEAGLRAACDFGFDRGLSIGIRLCVMLCMISFPAGVIWGLLTQHGMAVVFVFFNALFAILLFDCCKISNMVTMLSLKDILCGLGEDTVYNRLHGYAFAALMVLLLLGTAVLISFGGLTIMDERIVSWLFLKASMVVFWNLIIRVRMAELAGTHLGL